MGGEAASLVGRWKEPRSGAGRLRKGERVDSLRAGCGVTARDSGDALALIRERVCDGGDLPPVRKCVENVDVSSLDPRHVLPNLVMPPIWRGIWFPQGFADWKEQ